MNQRILYFDSVASTMSLARDLALQNEDEGIIVLAEAQTAGRGRAGHTWFSPPGQSLYLSILLRPRLIPTQLNWLTMIGALAIIDTIQSLILNPQSLIPNPQPSIKWFNDVHLNGRKISGVLVESALTGDAVDYAVLGIGLNVNTRFDTAPADVQTRATSLMHEFGREFERTDVLNTLLKCFAQRYDSLLLPNANPVPEYAASVETIGCKVSIAAANGPITGLAERIDHDGALIICDVHNQRHRCVYGEILA